MTKINIGGRELEFEKELVERFESIVCDSFSKSAEMYLITDFPESELYIIVSKYSEKEIKDVVINAAEEEIALYCS